MRHLNNYIVFLFISLITSFSSTLTADQSTTLNITGWDVYADPDHPDKTIGYKSFEQATGATIKFNPLSNLDDIITAAESDHHYDIFIISNEGIQILHDMGLLAPVNVSKLSNYQNLHHNLKYTSWSQINSKIYAVPWAWGPTGLMYNTDAVNQLDSWNSLWDPKFKGKVAMWDDISMIWTTALSLGYKNVYSLTRTQLEKVKNKLFDFNKMQPVYYKGGGDEIELAKKGRLLIYNSWYDPSSRLKAAGKNFAMIIPKEGAVGMFDSYLISKNHHHQQKLAHQYINHQISPEIQAEMARITGLAPANIETLSILKVDEIKALHLDDPDYFNRMILWDHMPRKNLYDKLIDEVREDLRKYR